MLDREPIVRMESAWPVTPWLLNSFGWQSAHASLPTNVAAAATVAVVLGEPPGEDPCVHPAAITRAAAGRNTRKSAVHRAFILYLFRTSSASCGLFIPLSASASSGFARVSAGLSRSTSLNSTTARG
jgi:hypothetical protein